MDLVQDLQKKIFSVSPPTFSALALEVFRYQVEHNILYKRFLQALDINPADITTLEKIPFLPVELFKTHKILTGTMFTDFYFESSGTTDQQKSKHYISDLALYEESIKKCFELFYGDIKDYCFLALLPSYFERKNASLIYMCDKLMKWSAHKNNGFYLNNFYKLTAILKENIRNNQKTILIGVSFALLDFAEKYNMNLNEIIIMETGGMKGRRTELTREELHRELKRSFNTDTIHSEYGMTELLSQAYSKDNGK
ncbi:MAG: acyl transferase, partial [Fimbriimonadaceae bacterium]|nr:acyl transferase [Chitinophagales bacterium]